MSFSRSCSSRCAGYGGLAGGQGSPLLLASTTSGAAAIALTPRPRLPPSSRSTRSPRSRRCFSHSPRKDLSSSVGARDAPDTKDVAAQIRALMRQSAQPVAIITAFLPPASASPSTKDNPNGSESSGVSGGGTSEEDRAESLLVHGATLSSLTTVSLDPPRVAFSLKLPSRMADALLHPHHRRLKPMSASQAGSRTPAQRPHFIINLLSSTQSRIAASLARPGTAPLDPAKHPTLLWSSASRAAAAAAAVTQGELSSAEQVMGGDAHPLHMEDLVMSAHAFSRADSTRGEGEGIGTDVGRGTVQEGGGGVPLLRDSLGALACTLETSLDLGSEVITMDSFVAAADSRGDEGCEEEGAGEAGSKVDEAGEAGSRLFIARVDAVEGGEHLNSNASAGNGSMSSEEGRLPLLYWRLGFTTVKDES